MKRVALLSLICVVFLYSVCFAGLENMKTAFLSGDYKAVIKEGEKILATPSQPENAKELYYMIGLSYLKDGNYLRSSDIFEILLNEYPGEPYRKEAMLGLGDAYFLNGDNQRARQWYEALLAYDTEGKFTIITKERLGRISIMQGDTIQAKEFLKDLPVSLLSTDFGVQSVEEYSVQVGYFSRENNAKRLVEKLVSNDFDAFVVVDNFRKDVMYRVKVGHYNQRDQAEIMRKKLTENGYPAKIVP